MFRRTAVAATACAVLAGTAACSSGFEKTGNGPEQETGKNQSLRVLVAVSGDAETRAVKAAAADWEKKSGHEVTVQLAKDIDQQLAQAFAGSSPPDAFYVNSDQFANYAKGGSLHAYGDEVPDKEDFAPQLRRAFTYKGELVCLPKDFSTLGLVVDKGKWKAAGLTEKDYPTTWEELEEAADKLTKGRTTGLVTSHEYQRLGVFMKQAGGWITDESESRMTADSEANEKGLGFAKKLLRSGSMKFAKQVDTGWAGEALGKGRAAMIIEGNWLAGAMEQDFPDVDYEVLPMPAGPAGKATLAFSNCWGVAQESRHREAAVDLVRHLTSAEQQSAVSDAVGVMPSRKSAMKEFTKTHPESEGWAVGESYAQRPVTIPGFTKVLDQFDSDLQSLPTSDPAAVLRNLQRNGRQVIEKGD